MNREAILDICGVKEVFEVPQTLMKKLFSPEQSDLLNRIAVIYEDRQLDHLENHLASQLMVIQTFQADVNYLGFISEAYDILNKYELYYNFGGST